MTMIADPITAALNELRFTIPLPILNKVFIQRHAKWRHKHQSINERIMEEVIRPRVLQDCNIAYGQQVTIDLSNCEAELVDSFSTVYRIPKELTQGRSILSALSVGFGTLGYGAAVAGINSVQSNPVVGAASALYSTHANMPVTSTASVMLIAENTILVRDSIRAQGSLYLRCVLENDERMTHLHYKVMPVLKQLVTQAVKSYIYNTYLIEMDQAELSGGQELGTFKNIIEGYSDAEELYQTILREKYAKAAMSTDYPAMRRYIKLMVGGYR